MRTGKKKAKKSSRNGLAESYARAYCKRDEKCLAEGEFVECGPGRFSYFEWCHLVGRRAKRIMFHPDNSVCMCGKHHAFFTQHPASFQVFIEKLYPGRWEFLAELERNAGKNDPDYWIEYYKNLGVKPFTKD